VNSKIITIGILRALAFISGVFIVLLFLYKIQPVLIYLAIASVLSLIARPFLRFLRKKLKLPNVLAVIITMVVFLLVLFGVISLFIPLIVQQGQNISLLNTNELRSNIKDLFHQIDLYFSARGIRLFKDLKNIDLTSSISSIPGLLNSVVEAVGSFSIGVFSVLFITFFFLKDTDLLQKIYLTLTPENKKDKIIKSFSTIKELLSRYFIGLIIQISILFAIYSVVLLVLGIKSAVVIAFLCALLNIIPYIGPIIGGVLIIVLTMTSNLENDFQTQILPTTIYVFIGYIFAQLIDNFFSQPYIFSKSVKSHPLEIFLIILIGGLLFGILGMIIAVPTYTAIKVILREFFSNNKIVKSLTKDLG
jgi:predicted PurR-regulated permease PerM